MFCNYNCKTVFYFEDFCSDTIYVNLKLPQLFSVLKVNISIIYSSLKVRLDFETIVLTKDILQRIMFRLLACIF